VQSATGHIIKPLDRRKREDRVGNQFQVHQRDRAHGVRPVKPLDRYSTAATAAHSPR
jgi:hypothetical protein